MLGPVRRWFRSLPKVNFVQSLCSSKGRASPRYFDLSLSLSAQSNSRLRAHHKRVANHRIGGVTLYCFSWFIY
eukprot:2611827-Amphidinium_carterae.1